MPTDSPLVETKNLTKLFPLKSGFFSRLTGEHQSFLHAVDGVDLSVGRRETVAVVGESGSGKTTLGLTILRLLRPTDGTISFEGKDITKSNDRELRTLRKNMQIVFQDPSSSLDPRKRIMDSVFEPLITRTEYSRSERKQLVAEALDSVGLGHFASHKFPHQFSGGQRQRISIARAIIQKPKFIVLDEPTSSLDVSVQSQILQLLLDLQKKFELSFLLVTHNMSVARYMADRIAVMFLGKIVEIGDASNIVNNPLHPYTQILLSSVLEPGVASHFDSPQYESEMPSQINPPSGCRYNTRCPYSKDMCRQIQPELRVLENHQLVACHFAEEISSNLRSKK